MRGEGECISRRKNSAQSLGKPFPFPRLKDFFIQLIHARASPACTTWWACLLLLWIFRTFESDKMWSVALSSKGHERVISSPQRLLITSISFSFSLLLLLPRIFQISNSIDFCGYYIQILGFLIHIEYVIQKSIQRDAIG